MAPGTLRCKVWSATFSAAAARLNVAVGGSVSFPPPVDPIAQFDLSHAHLRYQSHRVECRHVDLAEPIEQAGSTMRNRLNALLYPFPGAVIRPLTGITALACRHIAAQRLRDSAFRIHSRNRK